MKNIFTNIIVCYTRKWREIKIKGKYVRSKLEKNENILHWGS